jgi:hypothetical protein
LTSLSAKPLRFEAAREKEIYKKNLNEAKGKKSLSLFPDSSNQLMTLNKFFLSFGFREKKKSSWQPAPSHSGNRIYVRNEYIDVM